MWGGRNRGGPQWLCYAWIPGARPGMTRAKAFTTGNYPQQEKNRVLYEQVFDKLRVFCDKAKTKFRFAAHQFRNNCARFFGVFYAVVGAWW